MSWRFYALIRLRIGGVRWFEIPNLDPRINVRNISPPQQMRLIPERKSWFNRPYDQGIPIGNLTSQFGSNVYLCALDHWITRHLRPRAYLWYMDDLTLLDTDPERLRSWIEPIDSWLQENRKQCLNPGKTTLRSLRQGIQYLGYEIHTPLDRGGELELRAPAIKKWEFIQSVRNLEKTGIPEPGIPHPLGYPLSGKFLKQQLARINSRLGFMSHAKTYQLRKAAMETLKAKTAWGNAPGESPWIPIGFKKGFRSVRFK